MPHKALPRILHISGLTLCVLALLIAIFFMEKYLGLAPCILCIFDRIVIVAMALVFLIATVHNPSTTGHRTYAVVNLVFGIIGIGIASRHIYLQSLSADAIPDCAPDLSYMLDTFPLPKTLSIIFNTSGECAEVTWTFLNMSIAQQTLLLFIVLTILCATVFKQTHKTE